MAEVKDTYEQRRNDSQTRGGVKERHGGWQKAAHSGVFPSSVARQTARPFAMLRRQR